MRSSCLILFATVTLVPFLVAGSVPVGSLTTFGSVNVSGVPVPSGTAVFPGDVVETGASGAVFTLTSGQSLHLGANSQLRIGRDTPGRVEIVKGMSRVQGRSKAITLVASNWTLQGMPDSKTGLLIADVVRELDGKVSLNVTNGKLVAHSMKGNVVMEASAGRPVMLPPEAAPPSSDPSPQAAPPAGTRSSGVSATTIGAYAVGLAAIGVAAAAIATRDDSGDLRNQLNALSTQNQALTAQVNSLISQLTALTGAVQNIKSLSDQLNAVLGQLATAQSQLAQLQSQINALLAKVSAGIPLTDAEKAQLNSLQSQVASVSASISASTTRALQLIVQIQNVVVPSPGRP